MKGTATAVRLGYRAAEVPVRRAVLKRRPLTVSRARVQSAIAAGGPAAALDGPVMRAMPLLGAFERRLKGIEAADREALLTVAEEVTSHSFDLLGSGPTKLGEPIRWRTDFKTGATWTADHISRVPIVRGDGSDIKVPWELSRSQHLPILAAAYRLTGDRRHVQEIGRQITSFSADNPVEFGPNWACTMDVAIRAANWVAALALCRDAVGQEPWLDAAMERLLLHGRFIRSHLEYAETRGNHYLSDVVGLMPIAALFSGSKEGRAWGAWAGAEVAGELLHQVRPDGCDHEASIPYHRLVCELFLSGAAAADVLTPGRLTEVHRERLERMLAFVRDYTRPDGLAPQIGDADNGRYLPLDDYGIVDQRDHRGLFVLAGREYEPSTACAAYPEGGYWIMRGGGLYAIARCGDVGVGGLGSHAHCDQLSFELSVGDQPLIVDPGSYLYTADPVERNRFRSTAFHSTLEIDGEDQNPINPSQLFAMDDLTRAEALEWRPGTVATFQGRHHGYTRLPDPVVHRRRIEFDGPARTLVLHDHVESAGGHDLSWTLPLAPGARASASAGGAEVQYARARLTVQAPGCDIRVEDGWYSPGYGSRVPVPFLRVRARGGGSNPDRMLVLRANVTPR